MQTGSGATHSQGNPSIREKVQNVLQSPGENVTFHYRIFFRLITLLSLILLVLMVLFSSALVDFSSLPSRTRIAFFVLLVGVCVLDIYLGWKTWKPALIIRLDSLTINHFALMHSVVLEWDWIEGVTEEKVPTIGDRFVTRLKIIYRKAGKKRKELILAPQVLGNGDAAALLLKEILPVGISVQGGRKLDQLKAAPLNQFRYKGMALDEQGVTVVSPVSGKTKVIAWDRIVRLQAEGAFDSSRGPVALHLEFISGASTKRLTLRGVESYEFIEFIKLIMGHVRREAIDPGLFLLIEAPSATGKIDTGVALLIISGFILVIAGITLLTFYPPIITSTWIYPLLSIPLCLLPLVYALKLQVEKGAGGEPKKFKSRLAALGFNLGTIAATAILFVLSPASFAWLRADANAMMGQMEAAEACYRQAEKDYSENADFLFAFAQYYYKKKDWQHAADYYIRAYEKDPDHWFADPLERIPDSLHRAGRTREALDWCDTILSRYSESKNVVRVIKRKRAAIAKNADE